MLGRPLSDLALGEEDTDADLSILSLAELYAAAGLDEDSDGTHDAELTLLGNAVAAMFAGHCQARAADGSIATLMLENLVETFLFDAPVSALVLARRPLQEVASIVAGGRLLAESDYTLVKGAGIVRRPHRGTWCGEVVITYTAGFAVAPDALKYAAQGMVRDIRAAAAATAERDQAIRAITVDGIGSVQYAADSAATVAGRSNLPGWVTDLLAPYVNAVI